MTGWDTGGVIGSEVVGDQMDFHSFRNESRFNCQEITPSAQFSLLQLQIS